MKILNAMPAISRLTISLMLLLVGTLSCVADPLSWNAGSQGAFVTSLCADTHGHVFIATEGQGVWRFDPAAPKDKQYTQFNGRDGLISDDVYALLSDAKGRLWAGTLHGLSVYNGKQWKTYSVPEGVGGSRIFALASCPTTGDIWIATEGGLTRYLVAQDRWVQYSRLDGLPSDAVQCLAFNKKGDVFVGTQADGIAMATAASGYQKWRGARGPMQMPATPGGAGLPTSLINSLLVASNGTVYAGTTTGLARSSDNGLTWRFLRGADWEAKVAGLYHGPKPQKTDTHGLSLLEDYVTCLADDGIGHLLVGHRQAGLEMVSLKDGSRLFPGPKNTQPTDYVSALLPRPDGSALIGGYGGGVLTQPLPGVPAKPAPAVASAPQIVPALPSPAKPPTLSELNALLKVVRAVPPDKNELEPKVVALADDWQTDGYWLGRYGRYWACDPACTSPSDYYWGAGWELVGYAAQIGSNHGPSDSLRYWIESLYTTEPHCLEMPPIYLDSRVKKGLTTYAVDRRDCSQDDHGETYPQTMDGPHIYQTLSVPPGLFTLSLYFFTRQDNTTSHRDYRLSVRPQPAGAAFADITSFDSQPELAHGRVRQCFGGVWKRFQVRGPVTLIVQVNRNNSWNTELDGVMLDLVDENPPPYRGTPEQRLAWRNKQRQLLLTHWQTKGAAQRFSPAHTEAQAAGELFDALQGLQFTNGTWRAINGHRFYSPLLRWYAAQVKPSAAPDKSLASNLGTCYYQMEMYPQWEDCQRQAGLTSERDIEKALRWDGANGMGHGFEAVSDYVSKRSTVAQKGGETNPMPAFQPGTVEAGGH